MQNKTFEFLNITKCMEMYLHLKKTQIFYGFSAMPWKGWTDAQLAKLKLYNGNDIFLFIEKKKENFEIT